MNRVTSGEAEQFGFLRRFRQSPYQRVFAPTFANDQYSHPRLFSRKPEKDSTPNHKWFSGRGRMLFYKNEKIEPPMNRMNADKSRKEDTNH